MHIDSVPHINTAVPPESPKPAAPTIAQQSGQPPSVAPKGIDKDGDSDAGGGPDSDGANGKQLNVVA
jgi:hypothetical protein